uniref:Uncharacterized protein n=1 Tax=Physcomitrium patens TaxID=3218 RepID=A0A2K1K6T5_PHYPA|nr:hypothetical protein PHYPA_011389 [Physcomitrium patens]
MDNEKCPCFRRKEERRLLQMRKFHPFGKNPTSIS